jgi:hypothetical protein
MQGVDGLLIQLCVTYLHRMPEECRLSLTGVVNLYAYHKMVTPDA